MDLHILPGVKAKEVAEAHLKDVFIEEEHSCKCMTYWIDESRGNVFCLIEAPSMEKVAELHRQSHGLIPHKIIEVQASVVESFLGRVSDPEMPDLTDGSLKVFQDPSLRFILLVRPPDRVLLENQLGKVKTSGIIKAFHEKFHNQLSQEGGLLCQHKSESIISSFQKPDAAYRCAKALHNTIQSLDSFGACRIGITSGEPVSDDPEFFGEAIRMASRICFVSPNALPRMTISVTEKLQDSSGIEPQEMISGQDEIFLVQLFGALESHAADPEFLMEHYCRVLAYSHSQLYRKIQALTGNSPNALLNEFRLDQARQLLKKKQHSVAEISFETGFTSPSYFTKCFKKRYGILPLTYMELS